jgi:hypothetical protein
MKVEDIKELVKKMAENTDDKQPLFVAVVAIKKLMK